MRLKTSRRSLLSVVLVLTTVMCVSVVVIAFRMSAARTLLNERLIQAVNNGDAESALRLLERGADPNTPVEVYKPDNLWQRLCSTFTPPPTATVLHLAVQESEDPTKRKQITRLVRALIAEGADARRRDSGGRTMLMFATLFGSTECLQAVIDSGVDVNEVSANGQTALQLLKWKADFMDEKFIPGYREKIAALKRAGAKD